MHVGQGGVPSSCQGLPVLQGLTWDVEPGIWRSFRKFFFAKALGALDASASAPLSAYDANRTFGSRRLFELQYFLVGCQHVLI